MLHGFALVLSLLISGQAHTFVLDRGLTQEDCAAALTAYESTRAATFYCEYGEAR